MIIAIVVIRALRLQRLPKMAFVTLWIFAAARLMLPGAMSSRLKRPNASSTVSAAMLVITTTVVFATTSAGIPSYAASASSPSLPASPSSFSSEAALAAQAVDMKQDIAPYRAAGFDVSHNILGHITYQGQLVWVLYDEGHYTYCGPDAGRVSLQVVRGADGSIERMLEITDQQVAELTNLYRTSFGGVIHVLRDIIMQGTM